MYAAAEIRQLHIEVSTRCNAECPMCCRNLLGLTSPGLVESSMDLATFRSVLPVDFLAQMDVLDVCGAYGDPAMARDLLPISRYVRSVNPEVRLRIYTNGGIRSPKWWAELAGVPGLSVVFAIDGLTTNEVYRRRVDVERVLRNAKAFIDAGGAAQWDYIVFAHNEHEVERARQVSEDLGFATFAVKRTARFLRSLYEPTPELRPGDGIERHPIYDHSGAVVGELRPPADRAYVNEALLWARRVEAKAEYFDAFFDACAISCIAVDSQSAFLSAQGELYPCCWLYVQATLPTIYRGVEVDWQVSDLLAAHGGQAALDLRTNSVDAVVSGPFFAAVQQSWSAASVAQGRLKVCARVCGEGFGAYRKQFDTPALVP